MANAAFLQREEVLKYIDTIDFKTQYIKITILDNENTPLRAIEGRATGGSININSSSTVRRTGSLSLVTKYVEHPEHPLDVMNEVTNIETLISMNKRVKVEIGMENNGPLYPEHPMFWFTLGTYMIQNASVSYNIQQGIQISLKLMDKMALLNGEMGGVITESITHSPAGAVDTTIDDLTRIKNSGVTLRDLVESLVRDWGELSLADYRIDNIPETVRNLVRWTNPKYRLKITKVDGSISMSLDEKEGFGVGEAIGYTTTSFIYPLEKNLESKAGETVVQVLDKIKNTLGNYEYFFDVDGVFHFQEIQNLLNEGSPIDDLTKAIADKYFFQTLQDDSVYSFKDARLVTDYSNNPRYSQVKNDFVVWGKTSDKNDISYHLRLQHIDDIMELRHWKVTFAKEDGVFVINQAQSNPKWPSKPLTQENSFIWPDEQNPNIYYIDFGSNMRPGDQRTKDDDWRLLVYLQAIEKDKFIRTPFDKELMSKLPLLYKLTFKDEVDTKEFFKPIYNTKKLPYWLDVINTNDVALMQTVDIKQFGVETVGKRTKILSDEEINCLFASSTKEIEAYNFVKLDEGMELTITPKTDGSYTIGVPADYAFEDGPSFWQECVGLGTIEKSAYEVLRSALHEYLSYNNNINIQVLPVYHLDVNQRITVENKESDIYGDYVINTISLPLALNGMMTINARKAVERI